MTDTTQNNTTQEKKGTKVIKAVGFTNWRGSLGEENAVSFAAETISQLDDFLLNFDWTKIQGYEFPSVTDDFPVNVTFIHKWAREQHNITSPALRLRIANNLAWIASRIMFQAATFVKSQGRNRIMQGHVVSAWSFFNAFVTEVTWAGTTIEKVKQETNEQQNDNVEESSTVAEAAPVDAPAPAAATTTTKKAPVKPTAPKTTKAATATKRAPAALKKAPAVKKAKTVAVQ